MSNDENEVVLEIENGLFNEFYWLFKNDKNYIVMMKIVENAIDKYQKYIKENIRKQVCDKIRKQIDWQAFCEDDDNPYGIISVKTLHEILDRIEQGE